MRTRLLTARKPNSSVPPDVMPPPDSKICEKEYGATSWEKVTGGIPVPPLRTLRQLPGPHQQPIHRPGDGNECISVHYYILSKYLAARRFAEAVRRHWSIENNLHWQLDVTFQEDQCRIRQGHADANFSILRRTALSLLKNESTAKVGIKNKRLTAGWDESYLDKVLFTQ